MASHVSLSIYDDDGSQDGAVSNDSLSNRSISNSSYRSPQRQKPQGVPDNVVSDEDDKEDPPILFGDFTNWKGKEMIKLDDFVLMLAKKYGRQNQEMHEDFHVIISLMRKQLNGLRRTTSRFMSSSNVDLNAFHQVAMPAENVRSYEELSPPQQRFYDRVARTFQKRILNDWKGIIEQYLEYRKPFLVDAYQLKGEQYQGRCPDLYVLPVFMPAGKHYYLVKNQQTY